MNFDKHSNFNPKANFSEVKFGENMPVLEVELNEMQQIQNEARADIIRDSIPSGFVTLGEIDYEYCKSNDNQIKLKTESIAYVNGYRITIPQDTIIEIGESDKEREDLVFLEVWKEFVTDESELKEYGGEQNSGIENPIKDERYPIATSQRVALKYRIRVIPDMDFSASWVHCSSVNHPYIGWTDDKQFSQVYAKGGNELLEAPKEILGEEIFRSVTKSWNDVKAIADPGLWIAGLPEENKRCTKERYKCIDGFVYAIPMFRLKRKPNVGLASPFEYKKIHTQIDSKKFAHLVNQENVEKVHSVNVKGRTLHNLHHTKYGRGKYTLSASNNDWYSNYVSEDGRVAFDITRTGDSGWKYIHLGSLNFQLLKPNTKYLVIFEDVIVPSYISISFKTHMDTDLVSSYGNLYSGSDRVIITTNSEMIEANQILYAYVSTEKMGHFELKNVAIYEYVNDMENWDKSMFSFEPGIKSLGEESNNSITIENNLVKEGVYVPELQNNILPTYPEVTHITWGEDVVIPPELEIELKRGEELLQTITQLPVKLETTGDEKLHVKNMKGRTLVNVLKDSGKDLIISPNTNTPLKTQYLLNTSKKYFVKIFLHSADNVVNESDRCFKIQWFNASDYNGYRNVSYQELKNGVGFIIPPYEGDIEDAFKNNPHIAIWHTNQGVQGNVKLSFMCLEYQEGMENWELKYFEGMKSVEAPSIKLIGKNLFNLKEASQEWGGAFISTTGGNTITFTPNSSNSAGLNATFEFANNMMLKAGTKLAYSQVCVSKLSCNFTGSINNSLVLIYEDGTTDTVFLPDITSQSYNQVLSTTFTVSKDCVQIKTSPIMFAVNGLTHPIVVDYQLEVSDVTTTHEPYKTNTFSTPENIKLRGIGDVQDELNLLTGEVTERIGEVVWDGSENWISGSSANWNNSGNTVGFYFNFENAKNNSCYSDKLPLITNIQTVDTEGIYIDSKWSWIGIRVLKTKLNGLTTINALKSYLSKNPITVQYFLATPTIKTVDLSEDDYVGKSKVTFQLAEPLRKVGTYSDFIKGNTLFSNIGVEVLNGSENIAQRGETLENTLLFVTHLTDLGIKSNLIYSDKFDGTDISWEEITTADKEFIRLYTNDTNALYIRISKSKLATQDVNGFKKWLQDNPVTIYYVKANPMEIPLKEVSPLECDFSYYRQFDSKYTGYPKELPNGVRDVVIGKGIIKRYTRHLTFNGTESWNALSTDGDVVRAFVNVTTSENLKPKAISEVLNSYKLPFGTSSITREEIGVDQNSNIVLALAKSRLSSADLSGFKNYLGQNPIQVILEVNSPYQNTVTEDKCKPIPYMPLNSYVGSLYVAKGNNHTKLLTSFNSDVEVQTYHRFYSNEFNNFMDVTKKKSPYGHVTVPHSLSSNIHDGKFIENTGFILSTGLYESASQWIASVNKFPVKKGVTYHVKVTANDEAITENKRYTYVYKYDLNGNYLTQRIDVGTRTSFTSDFDGYALLVMKTMNVSHIQVTPNVAVEEEVKYRPTELIVQGIEKHEIEDLRHKVSLTGFDYNHLLQDSFLKLIKGELS